MMTHRIFTIGVLLLFARPGVAQQAANPHGALTLPCATCHGPDAWKPARVSDAFRHAPTTFPLAGAHARTTCTSCHKRLDFKDVPTTCATCHEDVHKGELGADCARCHTPRTFAEDPAMKQAHELTRFPLRGAHSTVSCSGCHTRSGSGQMQFVGRATTCQACHAADAQAVAVPDHKAAGFTDCTSCHSINTWRTARFDHTATRFALTGAHNAVPCSACHGDQVYRGKSMECASCHQSDFQTTKNPPHSSSAFMAPCTSCHTTNTWAGAGFNHDVTRFPLAGAHRATACMGCHADGIFAGRPMTCASCHQARYDAARTPPHTGFPTSCESCHGTTTWTGATFDHSASDFPLTGAHRATSCISCHGDGTFNGKAGDCASCHQARYDATTNPSHAAAGYSTACATCHTTTGWLGAAFNHSTTRFPLTGAHVPAPCLSCHADGVYRGKSTDCYSCHRTSYDATRTPPHGASAIGTVCTQCHTTSAWAGGTYDHSVTSFPLTGAHRASSCSGCHSDGVYNGKSSACLSCHQADYAATTRPPHGTSGIGTVCSSCHTSTAWLPGTFDHGATTFPLTGAHTTATCLSCHGDGVYRGKSTTCAACHQADYNQTTNPNHASAQFPTTCASCHATATWLGATFDHDGRYFPIYSGAHRARWSTCATCHTSPTDYKAFTCLTCHEHARTIMDQKHLGRTGYVYQSTACYACHPRGTH